jgi:uncharacterized membrane protein
VTDRALRIGLGIVTLAGIGVASYLTYVHYEPAALICSTGGGCETVQQSKYAVVAGVPIAIFGLVAWVASFLLVLWASELARMLLVALALIMGAFAIYLVVLQLFVIDEVCTWCMINDVVLVPLLVTGALWWLYSAGVAEDAAAETQTSG